MVCGLFVESTTSLNVAHTDARRSVPCSLSHSSVRSGTCDS
jgi:hypothetical protein